MRYTIAKPGGVIESVDDVLVWGKWFEESAHVLFSDGGRIVERTELPDGVLVSTVFLGIDHGFGGVPMFFETMIFGGPHNEYQKRYSAIHEAFHGHGSAVRLAKGEQV